MLYQRDLLIIPPTMQYTTKDVYEFISKQTNDPILEWKTCAVSGAEFPVYKSDMEFYDKISPTFGGKKYQIPTPTLCPEERQRRRLLFRNERKLYKRKCDASGKDIISIYAPDAPYKVYDQKFRWSDDWNPLDYGREFDFSRSFREQFGELMREVPQTALIAGKSNENSIFVNYGTRLKDCYLVFTCEDSQDCFFGNYFIQSSDCMDAYNCFQSSQVYESIDIHKSFNILRSSNCTDCHDMMYCTNCINCEYCYNCSNLVGKKYYINNISYNKDTYFKQIEHMVSTPALQIQPGTHTVACIQSFGNNMANSDDCASCFDVEDSQSCKYSYQIFSSQDCHDTTIWGGNSHLLYEGQCIGNSSSHLLFCVNGVTKSHYMYYCTACQSCTYCFGCIGLRNKEYCIFNKQYTKEEYEVLVPKIIEHMQKTGERGEFFHPAFSPFGYNETVAQEYFPISKDEAHERGYRRQDHSYDPIIPEGASVIQSHQVEGLKSDEDILKSIFICEISGRPFRIIKQELEFYRKHTLPLPRKHPDVRHQERIQRRSSRELHLKHCDQCSKEMLSVYPQEYQGKVYCEECYTKEIY